MSHFLSILSAFTLIFFIETNVKSTQVLRPRGVPLQKKIFYDPKKDFTCLDGSLSIPFIYVNDDYCDCPDGTDEPGTSACSNGFFHCPNVGYIEKDILSSRVNDLVCDCCDGSDEYNSSIKCIDNCLELGKEALLRESMIKALYEQGSLIRDEYIKNASEKKTSERQKLELLKIELEQLEPIKKEKESIKIEAEAKQKELIDKHRAIQEEKRKLKEEQDASRAQEVEDEDKHSMEGGDNGKPDIDDSRTYSTADNKNEELQEIYENQNQDMHDKDNTEKSEDPEYETFSETDDIGNEGMEQENIEEENHDVDTPTYHRRKMVDSIGIPEPSEEYDEETKQANEIASAAAKEYSEIESQYSSIQSTIQEINANMESDFGLEDEFYPLKGQCFEFTDSEYTYKLCPFDNASQRPKEGGTETNLGRWGSWNGKTHKYDSMKMEAGAQCWNGPTRSVDVSLKCGLENRLLSASEPARCEYHFEFETPALCKRSETKHSLELEPSHVHTEL